MKYIGMIQYNIKVLSNKITLFSLLLISPNLYSDIFINDDKIYYSIQGETYSIGELIISDNFVYFRKSNEPEWFLSDGLNIVKMLDYGTLTLGETVIIGVNSNVYSVLSKDGVVLIDNLRWAFVNENGIAIKESNEQKIKIITKSNTIILNGYDYAMPCSENFIQAWNVYGLKPIWFLLNAKCEVIEISSEGIIDFYSTFYLDKKTHIEVFDVYGKKSIDIKYSEVMEGKECLYLYNNIIMQWEILDCKLSKICTLEKYQIPITSTINNFMIIKNTNIQKRYLFNIEDKTFLEINDFFIGDKYLFVKYKEEWKRIF